MVVRLPAKTLTLADHPDTIHNKTRATFDQNNSYAVETTHKVLVIGLSWHSLQVLEVPYRWIMLNINLSHGYLLDQRLSIKSSSVRTLTSEFETEQKRKYILHPEKSAGNEMTERQDILLR